MVIVRDTRDKIGKHNNVDQYLERMGIKVVRNKMFVGDVTLLNDQSVCIDLKQNLLEIAQNVTNDRDRFVREIERARDYGIHLVFLIEHGYGINCLEDVMGWENPRLKESKLAISGDRLYRVLKNMSNYYGVEFLFCDKQHTGPEIVRILNEHSKQNQILS